MAEQYCTEVLKLDTDDGVQLHAEVTGTGENVLFLHEFSGDYRSWEPQVRALSRRFRCITYSARGFPGSAVPPDLHSYSQQRAVTDALAVLTAAGAQTAHVVGISMGAFTALHLALDHPDAVRSAVIASCGYGADVDKSEFSREMIELARVYQAQGAAHVADLTANSPYRLAFRAKDPRGFAEWHRLLAEHDALGAAHTIVGVQAHRPTLVELAPRLTDSTVPMLFVVGDEDDPCLEANLVAKRAAPRAGLAMLPRTSHTVNLEQPAVFNALVLDFIAEVSAGSWLPRDPRTVGVAKGWVR